MKTPHDALAALDRADREAERIKNDPHGEWDTLRHAYGIFAPAGQTWDLKKVWVSRSDDAWQAEALKVQAEQLAYEKRDMAHEAEKDSAISGITSRPITRS